MEARCLGAAGCAPQELPQLSVTRHTCNIGDYQEIRRSRRSHLETRHAGAGAQDVQGLTQTQARQRHSGDAQQDVTDLK